MSSPSSRFRARFSIINLRSLLSAGLAICLLSSSSPAAPQTLISVTKETSIDLMFWYHSSGLASLFQGAGVPRKKEQEKQSERDGKISRLEVFPKEVTVDLGEHVRFAGVAYDDEDNVVGGVKVHWSGKGTKETQRVRISPRGEFEAMTPGDFSITARAAGKTAQVSITVRSTPRPNINETPASTRQISSHDLPPEAQAKKNSESAGNGLQSKLTSRSNKARSAKRSHAAKTATPPAPMMVGGAWDGSNYWSADDPVNRVGDPPGTKEDGGAGSGNFQFVAPIYSLPGRGINISLNVAYNSRLWNKAGSQISYDNDKGWPAPGFNLGFGKLLGMTINSGCMLVDPDGTRHSYTGTITFYSWGTIGVMRTTDGSFIDYTYQTGTNGVITWAQAKLPNGTVITYGAYSQAGGGVFPTFIEDANGNFITITYVNNAGPRIQTVSDTAGRSINFHYNGNSLLTAITAPGLSGSTRTLARFHYHQHALSFGFSGSLSATVRDYYPWLIDAIYFPATGSGYWLNDSDSYSSYGMLAKVVEQRNMGFSASSLTDMGTVTQGTLTRSEIYNYPLTPNYSLTDAPTYTTMVESWSRDGTNIDSATTSYDVNENANPRSIIITLPNGTKTKQLSYNAPGQWNDGLVYYDETYVTAGQPLQKSNSYWQPGAYDSPRPTRVEKIDERNQTTAVEFSYGSVYNQVTDIREYNYGGTTLLRSTRTQYQNSANYTNRHIFSLPLVVETYDPNNVRLSRTEYQYDGQTLTDAPGVVMHDETHNPYGPQYEQCDCYQWDYWMIDCLQWNCYWVSNYNPATDYRGNVTQITVYADGTNMTGAISETRRYDITGNMITTSTSCCQQTSFGYTADTQFAYPQSRTHGSATDPYAQVTSSATYDFYTGQTLSTTDANGRTSSNTYDTNSLRLVSDISSSGAHTDYTYNDSAMSVTSITYLASGEGGGITEQNVQLLNGRGQVWREQAMGAGGVWDYVDVNYDNLGNVSQQSRPYRSGDTLQWSTTTYDALGRVTVLTAPDGSTMQTFYNEVSRPDVASTTPGETVRTRDAWGRERWSRADAQGKLVEVVEPIFWGPGPMNYGGMQTTYSYNTLGYLTQTNQGSQTRTFKYDSLGRLLAQKHAETSATLNDAGTYVGSGTWTDVFTYDDRSNLTSRKDARGVKTVYTYNNDPLNRLQSISWDTSGFGDTGNPILSSPTVTYSYRTKTSGSQLRDVTQVASITTSGLSTESFNYDTEGRISDRTLSLNSRASYPFVTDYIYDSLDRVKDLRYPAQYGNGGSRKLVHHDFDIASRLTTLTYNGQTQASNIVYNASSQATSVSVGTGGNQVTESYGFNAQTGLIDSQTVTRNGSTLLNLSYDYTDANGKRTGQLTKILNNLDHGKDRGFEYDPLGRLLRATGGQSHNWAQGYEYDRYGNRLSAHSYVLEDYIKNFYQSALNRQPNSTELNSWLSTLRTNYSQGQSQFRDGMISLGVSLFTSQEYINRNRNDSQFVYDLYKAYLYREPDSGGWAFWTSQVPLNGRNQVRLAFDLAPEFHNKIRGISPYAPAPGVTIPRDGLQGLTFNAATNRIDSPGWAYDAAGNQVRALAQGGSVSQRFQYDAANRLVKVKADDNVTVLASYTYGDRNERLVAEEGGLRTYYAGEGGTILSEYVESGASTTPGWSKSYVYLGGRLLSEVTPNGGGESVQYHHPDRLGTRVVTNPSTGSSFEQVALPFGTALAAESTGSTTRRFTSYDRSATTGLDYAVNRQYDSQQGRFTQVDPIGVQSVDLSEPQTLNLYTYCANDPVNHFDSDGLFWGKLFGFLKKALSIFTKVIKIIAIAALVAAGLAIAFAVIGIPGAAFLWSLAGKLLAVLKIISGAIGAVLAKIAGPLKGIFNFFGSQLMAAWDKNEKTGLGAIGVLMSAELLVKKVKKKVRQRRRQKRKQEITVQPVPVPPVVPPSTDPPRAMEPGPKDLDDIYDDSTCAEYGRQGRGDLESICRKFPNIWVFKCIRRCLLEHFGTSPGGVYGEPGEYRGPNVPWPFGRFGVVAHAKCFSKCGVKGALAGLGGTKG